MNRRKAVALISAASAAAQKKSDIRDRFVGVWKLVSCESKNKSTGDVHYPYGTHPVGRIIYDAAGRMPAQLMNPERRRIGGPTTAGTAAALRAVSPEEMREILSGFASYFGTFDVDESSRTVIHHVQGCLVPSWVGGDLHRNYEFGGTDRLVLTALLDESVNRLVWQRE
jgi:hypothetical protein